MHELQKKKYLKFENIKRFAISFLENMNNSLFKVITETKQMMHCKD